MALDSKRTGTTAFRLLALVLLLGCPRIGSAAGTWSVISLPQKPGEVLSPTAIALDAAGNLYVADRSDDWIQKRDAQGNCYENRIPGPVQARGTPATPVLLGATGRGGGRLDRNPSCGAYAASGSSILTLQPSRSSRCTNCRRSAAWLRASKYPAPSSS